MNRPDAPLHSSKRSVASSSGISVFPHSPQFADRFIVWSELIEFFQQSAGVFGTSDFELFEIVVGVDHFSNP